MSVDFAKKIAKSCEDILNSHSQIKDITLESYESDESFFSTVGGQQDIALLNDKSKISVVKFFDDFFINLTLEFFVEIPTPKRKTFELKNVYIKIFYDNSEKKELLFRAEWASKDLSQSQHAQPHWHFESKSIYLIPKKDELNAYWELKNDEISMFELEDNQQTKKEIKLEAFHFAMCSNWQIGDIYIHDLNEKNLKIWLNYILHYIKFQLSYCFRHS